MSNLKNVVCVRSKNESKYKSKKSNESEYEGETRNESKLESKKKKVC